MWYSNKNVSVFIVEKKRYYKIYLCKPSLESVKDHQHTENCQGGGQSVSGAKACVRLLEPLTMRPALCFWFLGAWSSKMGFVSKVHLEVSEYRVEGAVDQLSSRLFHRRVDNGGISILVCSSSVARDDLGMIDSDEMLEPKKRRRWRGRTS